MLRAKTVATHLQRCHLFPLHYGVCCPLSAGWRPPLLCYGFWRQALLHLLQGLYTVHLPTAECAYRLLVYALCTTCASRSTALACARYVFDILQRSTTPPRSDVVRACAPQSSCACLHYALARGCVVLEAPRRWRRLRGLAVLASALGLFFVRFSCSPAATATLRTTKSRAPARDHLCPSNCAVNKVSLRSVALERVIFCLLSSLYQNAS